MLGGKPFPSKSSIKQHFRQVISSQPLGSPVCDPIVIDLLQKHPKWETKSAGMTGLVIGEVEVVHASTKCKTVVIQKPDGYEKITWSRLVDRLEYNGTLKYIDNKKENLFKIKVAARAAIQDQILGVQKLPGEHIDHVYPRTFDRLLFIFLKWLSVPIAEIKIKDPSGSRVEIVFDDADITYHWQQFHKKIARLRAISEAENMAAPIYPVNWSVLP
jgi:hypothetical protein